MSERDPAEGARMGHPDLEAAVDEDDHGPVYEATFEGLDAGDDTAVAEPDQDGEVGHHE